MVKNKSNVNLNDSNKNFRQLSIMECFAKKGKNNSTFKFKNPTLVSKVTYEVDSKESPIDLDKTTPYDYNLYQNESNVNILSVVQISNNNFSCNEMQNESNIQLNEDKSLSSICNMEHNTNSKNINHSIKQDLSKATLKAEQNNSISTSTKHDNVQDLSKATSVIEQNNNSKSTSTKHIKIQELSKAPLIVEHNNSNKRTSANHNEIQELSKSTSTVSIDNTSSCFQDKHKRQHRRENVTLSPKKLKVLTEIPSTSKKEEIMIKDTSKKYFKVKEGKQLQDKQLKAFITLMKSVNNRTHWRNLLSIRESEVLNVFLQLDERSKYVFLKLYVWKRKWYNIFQFCKKANIDIEDDQDINNILKNLVSVGLVITDYNKNWNSIPELLESLSKNDVEKIMNKFKIRCCKTKTENIKKIIVTLQTQKTLFGNFQEPLMSEIHMRKGYAVKLSDEIFKMIHNIYILVTFTNPNFYDIQDYFYYEIHKRMIYPSTSIDNFVIFSRKEFEEYAEALHYYQNITKILQSRNSNSEIWYNAKEIYKKLVSLKIEDLPKTTPHLYRYRAHYLYVKNLSKCCSRIYTKINGFPEDVAHWLQWLIEKFPKYREVGGWYKTLIQIYKKHLETVDYVQAAKLIIKALSTPDIFDEVSFHELVKIGKQIKNSSKLQQWYRDRIKIISPAYPKVEDIPEEVINANALPNISNTNKKMFVTKDISNDEVTIQCVENVALSHYRSIGFKGFHCESSIIQALFVLLFWDIIYKSPRNVVAIFIASIQTAPLDIFTEYFYEHRKESIKERLLEIASNWSLPQTIEFATKNYHEHSTEWSIFGPINELIPDQQTVSDLITVIGQPLLSKILERLVRDLKSFRSGMPDLFLYNMENKKCRFVEVKSKNDKLATNQLLWLTYLKENGADVALCKVKST